MDDTALSSADAVLTRGLRLLTAFEALPLGEARVSELARQARLPLSTAYRYVARLRAEGFLEEGVAPGTVQLGLRLVALAHRAPERQITSLARPIMEELGQETGETILLIEPLGTRAICSERVETRAVVRIAFDKGRVLPLHAGASVRALLAFLPSHVVEAVIEAGLDSFTQETIADSVQLRENLRQVREDGYAQSESEMDPGVRAVAMPVCAGGPHALASLSVTGPAYRFTPDKIPHCLDALKRATARLNACIIASRKRAQHA